MKKMMSVFVCCVMMLSFSTPCYAASDIHVLSISNEQLENGVTVTTTVFEDSLVRNSTKTVTNQKEYKSGGTTIAIIAIKGTFSYNGSTSNVTSKSVSRKDTYGGWIFQQDSFTSGASSILLEGKLKKTLHASVGVDLTLACDKNGNISY